MKTLFSPIAAILGTAIWMGAVSGVAHAQVVYVPVPVDDGARYRYADESEAQYQRRVRRLQERAEAARRASPGPGLPSMEQQQADQQRAGRDAYARQRPAAIGQPPRPNAPRGLQGPRER